ncbi:MAG: hypothetical protein ACKVI4_13970 [Actinomycetales bacterium]|tara:strand:- start:2430 stop:3026 length:597 start_codon:yes stop_codon:yes gene_type:complete
MFNPKIPRVITAAIQSNTALSSYERYGLSHDDLLDTVCFLVARAGWCERELINSEKNILKLEDEMLVMKEQMVSLQSRKASNDTDNVLLKLLQCYPQQQQDNTVDIIKDKPNVSKVTLPLMPCETANSTTPVPAVPAPREPTSPTQTSDGSQPECKKRKHSHDGSDATAGAAKKSRMSSKETMKFLFGEDDHYSDNDD